MLALFYSPRIRRIFTASWLLVFFPCSVLLNDNFCNLVILVLFIRVDNRPARQRGLSSDVIHDLHMCRVVKIRKLSVFFLFFGPASDFLSDSLQLLFISERQHEPRLSLLCCHF